MGGAPLERMGVRDGDLERIRAPLDFLGINLYTRTLVAAPRARRPLGLQALRGRPDGRERGPEDGLRLGGLAEGALRRADAHHARLRPPGARGHRERLLLRRRSRCERRDPRHAPHRVLPRLPAGGGATRSSTAPTCAATTPGRCSTTSSGRRASSSASGSSGSTSRPASARSRTPAAGTAQVAAENGFDYLRSAAPAGAPDLPDRIRRAPARRCSRACSAPTRRSTRRPSRTCSRRSRTSASTRRVERAPYDPIISQARSASWSRSCPGGESDYLDALRAYTRSRSTPGCSSARAAPLLLDKTPAYALVLDFLARLYPEGALRGADAPSARGLELLRRVVLRRRLRGRPPLQSDPRALRPGDRALPARAPGAAASACATRSWCSDPAAQGQRLCAFLGLAWEPAHGRVRREAAPPLAASARPRRSDHGGPRDAADDASRSRSGRWTWPAARPASRRRSASSPSLLDEDLETWGYPRARARGASSPRSTRRRRRRPRAPRSPATRSSASCSCSCAATSTRTPSAGSCAASAASATCCCVRRGLPARARLRHPDLPAPDLGRDLPAGGAHAERDDRRRGARGGIGSRVGSRQARPRCCSSAPSCSTSSRTACSRGAIGSRCARSRCSSSAGVAAIEQNPPTPRAELEIAIAGPIASLLLALGFSALGGVFAAGSADALMFAWLGRINLSVAVFNLLPGLPLDGGRVLRAWLWARQGDVTRATQLAARVGQLLAYAPDRPGRGRSRSPAAARSGGCGSPSSAGSC